MISSLACNEPATGSDQSGYAAFLRRDIESLGRALVHSRMGKAPQYRISQTDLDGLALPWTQAAQQSFPPQRRLRRDLRRPEWAAIGGLIQPSERECAAALASYRSAVLAWLVPLCVASAGSATFVIPDPPAHADEAGKRVVAALKPAITS